MRFCKILVFSKMIMLFDCADQINIVNFIIYRLKKSKKMEAPEGVELMGVKSDKKVSKHFNYFIAC